MRILVTGGSGFIGQHFASRFIDSSDSLVLLTRGIRSLPATLRNRSNTDIIHASVTDRKEVIRAATGCDAIVHLAGINLERTPQTFTRVHELGTENVVHAAEAHDVETLVLTSYLRARPGTSSEYLQTKWLAEEIVRNASIPSTILKPAGVFGPGDQFLTNIARWIRTCPIMPIPTNALALRPVAIEDVLEVLMATLSEDRLQHHTYALMGPEAVPLEEICRRVARSIGRHAFSVAVPHRILEAGAIIQEHTLDQPIVTRASTRMLIEGMIDPAPRHLCDDLPTDLVPGRSLTPRRVNRVVSDTRGLRPRDLRILLATG